MDVFEALTALSFAPLSKEYSLRDHKLVPVLNATVIAHYHRGKDGVEHHSNGALKSENWSQFLLSSTNWQNIYRPSTNQSEWDINYWLEQSSSIYWLRFPTVVLQAAPAETLLDRKHTQSHSPHPCVYCCRLSTPNKHARNITE
ncbi:hypothetical protein TcWFU_006685 [Taenia crassiceps]|uniref:Uncharacterized protein n=1 Tax=Taenia crassiceps TaxID=6207 RepID=A0ABR4Q3Z0_9CEST